MLCNHDNLSSATALGSYHRCVQMYEHPFMLTSVARLCMASVYACVDACRRQDFPTDALTFEAWISSSDFCHAGTVMSYAKDSQASDEAQRTADFNHFVIFDPRNLLACHDFQYIDMYPDPRNQSCHASYRNISGSDLVRVCCGWVFVPCVHTVCVPSVAAAAADSVTMQAMDQAV